MFDGLARVCVDKQCPSVNLVAALDYIIILYIWLITVVLALIAPQLRSNQAISHFLSILAVCAYCKH